MANYTGTNWVTKTQISTDILSKIDEGLGQVVNDVKDLGDDLSTKADQSEVDQLNADLTDVSNILLTAGTSLSNETDLDEVTTPGHYYKNTGADTILNRPTTSTNAFTLFVIKLTGARTVQIFINYSSSAAPVYIRVDTTQNWYQFTTTQVSTTSSVGDPVVMEDEENA